MFTHLASVSTFSTRPGTFQSIWSIGWRCFGLLELLECWLTLFRLLILACTWWCPITRCISDVGSVCNFQGMPFHKNVSRVLAHYQSVGFLHLTPFSLAGHQPNLDLLQVLQVNGPLWRISLQKVFLASRAVQRRQIELFAYNDCFHRSWFPLVITLQNSFLNRNMYEFRHLAFLETNELIVPKKRDFLSWADMVGSLKRLETRVNVSRTSYCFR